MRRGQILPNERGVFTNLQVYAYLMSEQQNKKVTTDRQTEKDRLKDRQKKQKERKTERQTDRKTERQKEKFNNKFFFF